MKTSTPTSTLLKRHSLNKNFHTIEDNGEIEAEIKRRREEAINKSSELQRKSISAPLIAGFTASELSQHCKDCIKLSTENKINSKNAFSFLLIDVMAAMAKKADSEINKNFQVASCTLDASVKIYGYRVDAVHTEAIKMAGGVLSKEVVSEEQNNENVDDQIGEKAKLRRKRKKKLTVVHPDTLNAKSESDILMDVTPHQSFLMHKSDGNELLIKIPKYNDNCALYINSDYTCWPSDSNAPEQPSFKTDELFDGESLKTMLQDIKVSSNEHLCPHYFNTEFGKDRDDMSEEASDVECLTPDRNAFEFDANAPVEDATMSDELPEAMTQRNRLKVPLGGYESDQEIELPETPVARPVTNLPLADLKNRITLNPLEYSMFDEQVLKAWAGPSYWKVGSGKAASGDGKENENGKALGLKSTRKVKQKMPAGLFDTDEKTLVKHLACGDKTVLTKPTMFNWSPQNVTVPRDIKYKAKNFLTLYHFPNFRIELKAINGANQVEFMDTCDSESETREELEYCSNVSMQCDLPEDDKKEDEEDENEKVFRKEEIWDEKNMVALPNKVEKIPMTTCIRKKSVDIKYLKKCLWGMLTESETSKKADEDLAEEPMTFSRIMRTCPTNMPNNLASSLSAPQIFNALLHLTNEKCLVLSQDRVDKTDFVVSKKLLH